ncbi:MAG: amino acid adenylation domain-containing protein, partial [Flavitalea sp.]
EAYEHQEVPFEKIVDAVVKQRDMSRSPVFQVMFVLQNTVEVPELKLGDVRLSRGKHEHTTSQFDLIVNITETPNGLQGAVEYCTDLYTESTVDRMMSHFKLLLAAIVEAPQQQVGSLTLLARAEKDQILGDFNDTGYPYLSHKTVIELFQEQVTKTPAAIAIVFEEEQLTYQQLNERSNQLAAYLRTRGVKEETLVPICVERSTSMIVGVLGILKAGAAFVPVDPEYPEDRISYILGDAKGTIILSNKKNSAKLIAAHPSEIIELDTEWPEISRQPTENSSIVLKCGHLAYIIYTSGSTGKPKGVMIEHRNLLSYLMNNKTRYIHESSPASGTFIHLSYTFDASLTGIFMPLMFGKSIVISSRQSLEVFEDRNFQKYAPYDFIKLTPSHLALLERHGRDVNGNWLTKKLVVGGEALHLSHFDYLIEQGVDVEIINEYGPTEATVGCSTYSFHTSEDVEKIKNGISIGKPIDNTQLYILNDQHALSPVGVPGEIYIGGAGLARGYLNRPELTAEKFISNPYSKEAGSRLYKTGDLGRWLNDGNIEYLGRIDDQVKISGYRIELGEIESVLGECDLVNEVVVLAREDKSGNRRLGAYIVPKQPFDLQGIQRYAKEKLPEYMVPSLWMELDHMPLTSNGKIDRKTLPDIGSNERSGTEYQAPRTEVEQTLAKLWQDLLGVEKIGVTENFFDLGGNSLLAMRVISQTQRAFKRELAVRDLFVYPTIAALGIYIASKNKSILLPAIEVQPKPERIPLSFSQERLWFIDRLEGSIQYQLPAVLKLNGDLDRQALEFSLQSVVNRHESLRTVIREYDGEPYQFIKDQNSLRLTVTDGSIYNEDPKGLQKYIEKIISNPFDLSTDDMIRASLITLNRQQHVLVVTMHHIASDGWSTSILVKEVTELYRSYVEGRQPVLRPLPVQYADYAIWQRTNLQGEVLNKKIDYWREKLQDVSALQLPTDYPRPAVQSRRGAATGFTISKELGDRLQTLGQQQGTTLFMTLLASFKVLLHRYSGQEDICVGTSIAGREQQELEGLIGFFINTLA